MTVCPLDSALYADLLGCAETAALFTDAAAIAAMIRVERALAMAGAGAGVIPADAAAAIAAALDGPAPDPASLAAGTASAGAPVPALVAALRARLPAEAAPWLHWGATSQDIVDTALVLRLLAALDLCSGRLDALLADLGAAADRFAALPMAGRTRSQIAAPTSFGLRVARWAQPLQTLRADLPALRARVGRVQFGGAVGALDVLGAQGPAVRAALAAALGLADGPAWHTDRTAFGTLAGWCTQLAAALGKMAGDLVLMARSESGEARGGAGGGSSTMPQKANPVAAETVVALARFAATLGAAMPHAALHAEERDGAAWTLEWLVLPQLVTATAAALRLSGGLATSLVPDADRMQAMLALGGGAAMAERANFLLAAALPADRALATMQAALADAAAGGTLAAALERLAPGVADWPRLLDPAEMPGAAAALAELRRG